MRFGSGSPKPKVKFADATQEAYRASGTDDERGRNMKRLEKRAFNACWIERRRTRRASGPRFRKIRRTGRIRNIPRSSPGTSSAVGIIVPPIGDPNMRNCNPEVVMSPLSKTRVGRFLTPDAANRCRIALGRVLTCLRRPGSARKRYVRRPTGKKLPTTRLPMNKRVRLSNVRSNSSMGSSEPTTQLEMAGRTIIVTLCRRA